MKLFKDYVVRKFMVLDYGKPPDQYTEKITQQRFFHIRKDLAGKFQTLVKEYVLAGYIPDFDGVV